MGSIGIWQLAVITTIVVFLFGTRKLRGLGSDLGATIKGVREALTDESREKTPAKLANNQHDETREHKDRS